jgi:hypothetical protein
MAVVYIILIILAILIYIAILYLLFYVAVFLAPIGAAVFIGVVLFNYLKVMYEEMVTGTGWADSPTGAEPAFKQYFFRKAFRDYWVVVEKSGEKNLKILAWVKDKGVQLFTNSYLWITFPLALGYIALMAMGTVAGALAYVLFGLVHLTIVLSCATVAIASAYTLRGVEYLLMLKRRISLKCPNGACHGDISLPHYICPNTSCGAKHVKLLPGDYGVVNRQCKCGAWLPTLFLFGRNRLNSYCPSCNKPLNSSIGVTRNIHVPIIGGRSAGKSHFLVATMMEIHRRAADGKVSVAFPEKKYQDDYDKWKRYFETGNTVDSTFEKSPDALLVNINSGGADCLLYMYDPAGELFQLTDEMRSQEYFDYINGAVFLIDPFSLPGVQHKYQKELSAAKASIRPSVQPPQEVYSNLLQILQTKKGVGGRSSKPLSVVLTKTDAFDISNEIQGLAAAQPPTEKRDPQSADESAVRAWLEKNGEGNLLRGIERDFKNVSYFYCSPLGRLPDASARPFAPKGVLKPLGWLLRGTLDFEHGTPKPISQTKTLAAPTYVARVSTPGVTINGKVIAGMWALSVIVLLTGSIAFAVMANSRKYNYVSTDYSTNTSSVNNGTTNSNSSNMTVNRGAPRNSNSSSTRSTSVRASGAALKRDDGSVIKYLSANEPLKVIKINKPWYWVETRDGTAGWIHGNDIYPLR